MNKLIELTNKHYAVEHKNLFDLLKSIDPDDYEDVEDVVEDFKHLLVYLNENL